MILFDADRAVFGENHPLGRPQIGTPESLARLTLETLHKTREELLIRPWGFAVGNISENLRTQLTEKFNDHYSSFTLHNGQRASFPPRKVPPNNIITSVAKEDANAYLCINIVIKSDPNIIGLIRFSNALMGESYGSRMFTILRDQKAFGYIVGSTLKLISDEIILRYYMETKPSRAEEALDTLTEIIVDIGQEEISEQEYNMTRDFLLGQLDISFDNSREIAARIINRATHGLVPNVEMGYEEIQRVSSEEILTTWKKLLSPNNFSLAIVGNIEPENIEKKWKNKTFSNQDK
ncbi:MAG: M16 family metallopeptidase [Candidatus Hodarchaeales archaeon]|jgi:predicted Zn-dependent peptidase